MLVRTPVPQATESLLGYVLRVSEANGYDTPWHVLAYAGFDQGKGRTAGFQVAKLAAVLGREASELERIAYCSTSKDGVRYFKILAHRLGASLMGGPLRLDKPAFCPHCVQESGFLDALWDLSLVVACPQHRCRLLNACPTCGKALRWFRPGLLTCECGASLANAVLEPASAALVELMAILKAKLHGAPIFDQPNTAGFPLQTLENLSLRSLLGIASGLGSHNLVSKNKPKKNNRCLTMESATEVLADWPSGYHQFLHRLGTIFKSANPSAIGLRKQFEQFYSAMFKGNAYAADARFLRDEFVRFGLTAWGEAIVDKKLLSGSDMESESRFLSNSEIARRTGVRSVTLRRWAQKGLLPRKEIRIGNQVRYILDVEAVALAKQAPGRIMETREAAAWVGLPVSVLVSLKKSRHFATDNMPRHKKGFHETDLENFRQRVLCSTSAGKTLSNGEPLVSLQYILQEVRFWSRSGKAGFVAAYLDGAIDSVGRTGDSWQDILFRKSDVETYARRSRMATSDGALSQQEAAKIVGCDPQAIPRLIAMGHLVSRYGPDRIRVERQSLEKFSAFYVAVAAIAEQLDTSVARLLRLCAGAGIEILNIPRKRSSAIPFIARENQDALLQQVRLNPTRAQAARAYTRPVARLRHYLDGLRESGTPLPRRGRIPNKRRIAEACGFDRNVLYKNSEAVSTLESFDAEERQRKAIGKRDDVDDLWRYLESLKRSNDMLPRGHKGRPNRLAIARACGIPRNIFYTNPEAAAVLQAYDEEVRMLSTCDTIFHQRRADSAHQTSVLGLPNGKK